MNRMPALREVARALVRFRTYIASNHDKTIDEWGRVLLPRIP